MDDIQTATTSKQPDASGGKRRRIKMAVCFSKPPRRCLARVYGSSNLYHSSSRVLNVMRKCQPTGKIQFLTRFTIICSSWGCTDVWCFNGMSEERTDYADLIYATKPEKAQRELPFRWDVPPSPCHFFCFETPSFECHWQRPSARLQLRSQQGGTTRCFTPPAEMTFVGGQNPFTCYLNGLTQHSDWTLMLLVSPASLHHTGKRNIAMCSSHGSGS